MNKKQDYLKKFKSSLRYYKRKGWTLPEVKPEELSFKQLKAGAQKYITGKAYKIDTETGKTIAYSPIKARQEGVKKAQQTLEKRKSEDVFFKVEQREKQIYNLAKAREIKAQKRMYETRATAITSSFSSMMSCSPKISARFLILIRFSPT